MSDRRLRSDAIWNQMTEEQQKAIHDWLFEEKLSYREIARRARDELGLELSHASVGRIYQHLLKFQAADEVVDGQSAAEQIAEAGAKLGQLRGSSLHVIGVRLLEKAMDHGEAKEIATLGRIILEAEEREIQRERTALARERFEFNASKAALAALPLAHNITREELEQEQARLETIKNKLFGKELGKVAV